MEEILFWIFLPVCFIAGIVMIVRGFIFYKEPFKSKMQFFLSGLTFLAPREIILAFFIWHFVISGSPEYAQFIAVSEIILLLVFCTTLLGKKISRVFRNYSMCFSFFLLLQLLGMTLVAGFFSLTSMSSGSILKTYFQWSDGFRYVEHSNEVTIMQYTGDEVNIVIPSVIHEKPVTEIAEGAFQSNDDMTSITIPEGVSDIGDSAFEHCDSLTDITIPDGVTRIGFEAFSSCDSLKSITIPDSVITIEKNPFLYCYSLKEINVSTANTAFASVDGILYSKNVEQMIACPGGRAGAFQIPDSVKYIGESCFAGCGNLQSIKIPDQINRIESWTFNGCSSLREITIPDGVTSIGYYAFSGCQSLDEIQIPAGVTSIDSLAFDYCSKMTAITVSPDNLNFSSDSGILYNKEQTVLLRCPSGKSGSVTVLPGVTSIGDYAFHGCEQITSVTLPDGVTNIGNSAFFLCSALTSIELPDGVTDIGSGTFAFCKNLTSITIPDSVTSIDRSAFTYPGSFDRISVVIYCRENSYAHTYTKDEKIAYELID